MKPISEQIFSFSSAGIAASPAQLSHERCSAKDLALPESWLRDAIAREPEIVIGPCRAAGLDNDDWYLWKTEFPTEVGNIDVLLVSTQGRPAVVETKLASNPDNRRKVLAQALDYLSHLDEALEKERPMIPLENGEAVADLDDIRDKLVQGDVLVIIASDEIDSRVAKLSRTLLAKNLNQQWDLALIDVGLYRPQSILTGQNLIVSTMRGLIQSEARHTVRVVVEGDRTRVTVDAEPDSSSESTQARQRWNEKLYFESMTGRGASQEVQRLAKNLRDLGVQYPGSVTFNWGTGKKGTMVLKRDGGGLIEVRSSGKLRFRPNKFSRALGVDLAAEYRGRLEKLVPSAMNMAYPLVTESEAAAIAAAVFDALSEVIAKAERKTDLADPS